jgi:syntaxin 18
MTAAAQASAAVVAAMARGSASAAIRKRKAGMGVGAPLGSEERAEAEAEAAEVALHEQEFAQENAGLVSELVERRERMREAERTVAEIAGLNQLFATKVLEQAREIEHLYDLAIEATTHIDRGNKELRKMKGRGPVLKFWLAFAILVLAFALLFLDWMSRRSAFFWIL